MQPVSRYSPLFGFGAPLEGPLTTVGSMEWHMSTIRFLAV